jgi:hypothetical protein
VQGLLLIEPLSNSEVVVLSFVCLNSIACSVSPCFTSLPCIAQHMHASALLLLLLLLL